MIIALWMEDLAEEAPAHHNKVGAVLVSSNGAIMAADCSRDEVHAVERLLTKHHDKAEGCKMFLSRKPCLCCAKLLVESKVKRVLYLPFEPEYYRCSGEKQETQSNADEIKQVDTLLTTSPIAQTEFVPKIQDRVIDNAKQCLSGNGVNKETYIREFNRLIEKYNAFEGESKSNEELRNLEKVMEWIAVVLVQSGQRELNLSNAKINDHFKHTKRDQCFMEIARFLAQRSHDPQTGVGAVIVSPEDEILAFGWNGKTHDHFKHIQVTLRTREIPRFLPQRNGLPLGWNGLPLGWNGLPLGLNGLLLGLNGFQLGWTCKKYQVKSGKRYPYVNHAEQNALLMRNTKSLKDATLYVTKSPCDECAPLISIEGIKTVFVDDDVKRREQTKCCELGRKLSYNWFVNKVDDGTFTCYKNVRKQDNTVFVHDKEHSDGNNKFLAFNSFE